MGDAGVVDPLPFAPFEQYMLVDDRPEYPMAYFIRMVFSGMVDREAFRQAAAAATARYPLFRSIVQSDRRGRPLWVELPDHQPAVYFVDSGQPLRFAAEEHFDLSREPGLRLWVRSGDDQTEVRVQVHHSVADGVGSYQLIEDLLRLYAAKVAGQPDPELPRLDAGQLAKRHRLGYGPWLWWLRLPLDLFALTVGMPLLYVTPVAPLASAEARVAEQYDPQRLIDWPSATFSAAEVAQLRDAARHRRATINDLFLAMLFAALHDWNERINPRLTRRMVRVMVPFNLRGPADSALPGANLVGMAFVDRSCRGPDTWFRVRYVAWQMRQYKRFQFGASFPRIVGWVRALLGTLAPLVPENRCMATSVLSNMGRVFHATPLPHDQGRLQVGNLRLEFVESAPPIRPQTHAAFSLVSYAGRLTLLAHYDRRHLSATSALALLRLLVDKVCEEAGLDPASIEVRTAAYSQPPVVA